MSPFVIVVIVGLGRPSVAIAWEHTESLTAPVVIVVDKSTIVSTVEPVTSSETATKAPSLRTTSRAESENFEISLASVLCTIAEYDVHSFTLLSSGAVKNVIATHVTSRHDETQFAGLSVQPVPTVEAEVPLYVVSHCV